MRGCKFFEHQLPITRKVACCMSDLISKKDMTEEDKNFDILL